MIASLESWIHTYKMLGNLAPDSSFPRPGSLNDLCWAQNLIPYRMVSFSTCQVLNAKILFQLSRWFKGPSRFFEKILLLVLKNANDTSR